MKKDALRACRDEALRYLRVRGEPPEPLREQVERVCAELAESFPPRFVYRAFPLDFSAEGVVLTGSGVTLAGTLARRMLSRCDTAALLVCTLGLGFEQRLRALTSRDMGEAVVWDACGSAWVERGCEQAEDELRTRFPGRYLTDRFSPGYGDLPFDVQPAVLSALNAARRLGVVLGESLMMTPSKSVTAIVGVADTPQPARVRGCAFCTLRESCEYRKGGTSCEAADI
ncbi:MAG: methionine synthase [Ruminococcaceae bacterium]|nr:methionine synthase [Oscillospiraceae bacterium]